MVNTKLDSLIDIQGIKRKESMYTTTKNYQLTKNDSKRWKQDKGTTKQSETIYKMVIVNPHLSKKQKQKLKQKTNKTQLYAT